MKSETQTHEVLRILIVEDSGLQAKAIIKILQDLGYSSITACPNANSAAEKLSANKFGLILCDWQMPGKSGLQFLKELRETPEHKDIPFIFLTAQADKANVIEALRSGAQDYIVKPPNADLLKDKIARIEKARSLQTPS